MVQPPPKISLRERFNISRLAIKYSWLTVCFWLAVTVAGLLAFSSLKYALFPDITFPVVVVNAKAPLETALETEAQVTKLIEEPLQSLKDLDELYSSTYPGQTAITLLFYPGRSLESSTDKVKTALEQLPLPPEATFEVIPFNLNESTAISYAIKSDSKTLKELTKIAKEQIIPPITQLPGVLKVNLLGNAKKTSASQNSSSQLDNPPTLVRFNGQNALAFQVLKRSEANTLEVVSQVEKAVQKLQADVPEVQLVLAQTQADYIREATQATIDALILGIIFAILVIFPFLRNFQATLITALAIPISLLGTFIFMALFGFNLETITLLALALVIGIIVDDAIVEVENIARHIEAGETPQQAAILATREIGLTVSASTLTIVAVFLPVALMDGAVGKFFKPFGLTVSAAVLTSLLVARTLSPVLAVYWLKLRKNRRAQEQLRNGEIERGRDGEMGKFPNSSLPITNHYRNLLHWSLHHRIIVVGLAIFSLIAGIALIPLVPKGFIPKLDRGEFNIVYTIPLPKLPSRFKSANPTEEQEGKEKSPDETASVLGEGAFDWLTDLAKSPTRLLLRKSRKVGKQIEEVVLAEPEVESVFTIAGVKGEPTKGKLYVKLKSNASGAGFPGRQLSTAEVQDKLRAALPTLPGVSINIEDIQFVSTESEKNLQVTLVGDDLEALSNTAQELKTRIEKLPGFVDVTVTGYENKADTLVKIERLNGQRAVYFSANLSQGQGLGDATAQVVTVAQSVLADGVSLELWGDSAHSSEVLESFAGTLGLSVICMLLLLILPFGRLLEPIVVGLSLPLSIVGAMLALLVTQSDFGLISLIGLIFLLGLLDKNAILLMDYANQLRKSGLSRTEAILETGVVRLRPILMTTVSTILGMLPIALGFGAGAELRQPMAVTIIGGLITSSLLSLIVVPVLYTLLDDVWSKVFRNRRFG
ncbi:MAG: efflux RND transporter permease subunit [Xenococcaceae cyanobacterium]